MTEPADGRELWIMGLGDHPERCGSLCRYLKEGGYRAKAASAKDLAEGKPLGILLDLSPFSADGWGILLEIKKNPATRDIPVLPLYLSEEGKVGGVFPAAGFITLPVDSDHLAEKLTILGLSEDAEDYDLQALVISRKGEEQVAKALESAWLRSGQCLYRQGRNGAGHYRSSISDFLFADAAGHGGVRAGGEVSPLSRRRGTSPFS